MHRFSFLLLIPALLLSAPSFAGQRDRVLVEIELSRVDSNFPELLLFSFLGGTTEQRVSVMITESGAVHYKGDIVPYRGSSERKRDVTFRQVGQLSRDLLADLLGTIETSRSAQSARYPKMAQNFVVSGRVRVFPSASEQITLYQGIAGSDTLAIALGDSALMASWGRLLTQALREIPVFFKADGAFNFYRWREIATYYTAQLQGPALQKSAWIWTKNRLSLPSFECATALLPAGEK